MATQEFGGVLFSDSNHEADREAVKRELAQARGVTELCVRNNHAAPTSKKVWVFLWTADGRYYSFQDLYLATGETRATNLLPLNIRVVTFEIQWTIIGSGFPMPATTGKINATPGAYFPTFGIRWDSSDQYHLIFPD